MDSLEEIINSRINNLDIEILNRTVNKLKLYNVNLFNNQNEFIYEDFRNDYFKTYDLLFKNDILVNGIKYQLCDFMSAVQVIVGIRNFNRFLSGK